MTGVLSQQCKILPFDRQISFAFLHYEKRSFDKEISFSRWTVGACKSSGHPSVLHWMNLSHYYPEVHALVQIGLTRGLVYL